MRLCAIGRLVVLSTILVVAVVPVSSAQVANHVIHVSIDGLNANMMQTMIDAGKAPTLKRIQHEGASTNNARTDFSYTNTLPDHTTMLTCRPVDQPDGMPETVHHGYTANTVPGRTETLHNSGNPALNYVASVFDVAHDAGLTTALYASKEKFTIYDQSYNETTGADHHNGRDKIDTYFFQNDGPPFYSAGMNDRFLEDMADQHFHYVFIHYRDTDSAGHESGWGSGEWNHALMAIDGYLAKVIQLVESDEALAGHTTIIITTDHGGIGTKHGNVEVPENYTIPLLAWGAGVGRGDLYAINARTRKDPGTGRPDYNAALQPIRNGDTGNLALWLLGLDPVPGSLINAEQDLRVALEGDFNLNGNVTAADYTIWQDTRGSRQDLRADADHNGVVDQGDYEIWRANYGRTSLDSTRPQR